MSGLSPWLTAHRLTALVGHSGTGKTEVAVNMAVALARAGVKTALADLDVVNPYSRSRERQELFRQLGIRFVSSAQAMVDADVPSLPAELNALLQDGSLRSILDVGGEKRNGLTVDDLLHLFKENVGKALDNDRMLLS